MKARSFIVVRLRQLALAVLVTGPGAYAADGTWTFDGNGTWTTSSNWASSIIADGTDSTAFFTSELTTPTVVTLGGDRTIGNITFTDPTSNQNLTLTGNTLPMNRTSGVPSIDVTQGARTLTIASVIAGNDGLEKNGLGTLTLTGTNIFSGGLTIKAGTVGSNNGGSGGNFLGSGTVTIGDTANTGLAATLNFLGSSFTSTNPISVVGNGTSSISVTGWSQILNGAITLSNDLRAISNNAFGSSLTFGGGVTGTGNLTIQSNAATGTNSSPITFQTNQLNFTGSITNSGTGNSTSGNINTTISAVIGTSVTGVTQSSANSQLILTGNNTFTGNIVVSAGTLQANRIGSGANPTAGALGNAQALGRTATINSGGTLNFVSGDVMGNGGSAPILTLIANGGTIRNNAGANFFNVLGPVQLNGGTLSSFGGGSAAFPSFALTGGVTVGGSAASTISTSGANSQIGLQNAGTTFNVTDAVSGSDLNVTGVLASWNSGTGALIKTGNGTMTLSNVNTYTGSTTINAGTLAVNGSGSINTSSGITLSGGQLNYNSSVALTAPLTFTSGTVGGTSWTGSSLNNLTIGANRTISPGNSPGTASTGNQTWASGGNYTWEVNNATGTLGADPGWDLLSGTGNLTITANSTSQFNILVTSLTLGNVSGDATNFLSSGNYTWRIADFASTITTFDSSEFNINLSAFTNSHTGAWAIVRGDSPGITGGDASQVYLTYVAVPEPGTIAMLASGAAILGLRLVRRRRG